MYVVVPCMVFCCGGLYLIAGRPADQQTTVLGGKAKAVATITPASTRVVTGETVLGGQVAVAASPTKFGVVVVSPTSAPVNKCKCYARVDTHSVYGDVTVYAEGLFYAEAFTRARGGMIWNARFGWFWAKNFGCEPGLDALEVEFIEPPKTATPKPTIIYPTRTRTPPPTVALPTATLTPVPGILLFDVFDCHNVRWLAWGVSRVYLTVGKERWGVEGDVAGQPAQRDLCDHVGERIRLDVFLPSGQQLYREGVLQ